VTDKPKMGVGTVRIGRRAHLAGVVLLIAFLSSGFGVGSVAGVPGRAAVAAAPESERIFVYAIDADPSSLDPHTTTNATDNLIKLNVYEALLRFKPNTVTVEPWLATEWRVTPDGLTYNFTLRRGVKFHDGTEFDAAAAKFSMDRMKTINRGLGFVLRNATVAVTGRYTLRVSLSKYDASFFPGLASVMMVSPAAFGPRMAEENATRWAFNNAVGTGPFRFERWEVRRRIDMVKFQDYWGGWNRPHVDRIVHLVVQDSATRRLMLERGDVDVIFRLEDQPDDIRALRQRPGIAVRTFPTLSITYIVMATHRGPLRDVRVRKALSYAVDYNAIQFLAYGFQAKQARGPLNSTIPYWNRNLFQYKRDLDRARQLLAEAGHPRGGFSVEFGYVGTVDNQRRIVEIVQQNLAELGITVVPKPSTFPVLVASMQDPNRSPELFNLNNHSAYPDPDYTFSQFFHSSARGSGGLNGGWYSNPEADRLIEQGATTADPARRREIYTRLQTVIVNDTPMIWNAELVFVVAYRDYVKGLQYVPAFARSLGYFYGISVDGKPR
jgi:peptide/nickel transport system substrate-binding protein